MSNTRLSRSSDLGLREGFLDLLEFVTEPQVPVVVEDTLEVIDLASRSSTSLHYTTITASSPLQSIDRP